LLILDEPTNGLDPAGIVEMRGLIRSFADDGITVLVSSHLISEIEQVCDHVVMIRGGQLVHQGPVAELAAGRRPDVVVAPEHAADLARLARVLEVNGLSVAASPADGTVVVSASGRSAADLNRLAAGDGITLRQISERSHSLEDVFFQLTGTDTAMSPGQEMGAIR
jgi:ABC-2 type transport system ATP-binding protein